MFVGLLLLLLMGCQAASEETPVPTALPPTALPTVAEIAQVPTATTAPTNTPLPAQPAGPTAPPTNTATATNTATPTHTATPTDTATPTISPTPSDTPTATASPTLPPSPTFETAFPDPMPAMGGSYLGKVRLISFYGSPLGRGLGILGNQPRADTYLSLRNLAGLYQPFSPGRAMVPTFHMVTTVADAWPGQDGNYSHQVDYPIIANWVEYAHSKNAAVVIDIQPAHADLIEEVNRVKDLLYYPHAHLALDPEFMMEPGEVPGIQLGEITAEEINAVQAILNDIGAAIGINRVLIIHQFETEMVLNKPAIQNYPFVELVFDADGFGPPGTKLADYWQYAGEPGFEYGGLKMFYEWDSPLLQPNEIMNITPLPSVIIYQ
ncbi:MAG: hypothetical protein KDE59_03075 [Anaerolineales bacterium]|nr:hypothetical protein [Anaerolineales bacterium]MCB0011248.1 hypothetical protein [Anaerolineales bacterium]MCB8962100.1 hypothetical protein [Ardenticatenales bacterium]